ncbi:zinc ribbon domain-containing protein [Sediminispirochaeta bajacaliforniensis]|uniref:zinc ribbon domain-containing protein n=1 Tax=Sediminispirochaeta bajacaliforniensis TaxID=148 RepID=UPI000362A914|nr:zinc ribbon domain-containing protein [Sediminispirochaeta bajacaliforniensis]
MAYCPRCGVEVEDRLEACPLCDTPIPQEVREHQEKPASFPKDVIPPKPLYRKLTDRQKNILRVSLILFLGLFPIALTAGIDLARNGDVTWSYYVAVPLIGGAIIAWLFVKYGKKPLISVTAMMLIVLIIQLLVGYRNAPGRSIHASELPYFLASFAAVELFLLYIVKRRPPVLLLLAFLVLDAILLIVAIELITSATLSWSLIVVSALFPLGLYLVYARYTKKKGLNLAGFFFLDLTVMMIVLNLSIQGKLTWSLITALIFLPISAFFYVLHVVLFNDTDWKKALHL